MVNEGSFRHAFRSVAAKVGLLHRLAAFTVLLCTGALPGIGHAQTASVGPLDEVRLRVLNWSPVEEVVEDWPALSGEYRIDSDGMLTIPFIGPVQTGGQTGRQIADGIAESLRERFALSEAPVVALDLVGIPTVVVGGLVREPGAIEYRPGMTVRHAVALAGGLDETLTPGTGAFRDYIVNEGQLRVLVDRNRRQQAVLARLEAERSDAAEITPPATLTSEDDAALLAEQAEILERRRARLTSDLDALAEQIDLFQAEIASLLQKVQAVERQRELAQEALENARTLAERGLTRNDRLVDAERTLISVDNQLLDTSTAILRARQAVSLTMRERETLVSGRQADIVQQILDLRAEIVESDERIRTTERLLDADADRVAQIRAGALAGGTAQPEPTIMLFQAGSDGTGRVADLGALLRPGDLLEVALPDLGTSEPAPPAAEDIN